MVGVFDSIIEVRDFVVDLVLEIEVIGVIYQAGSEKNNKIINLCVINFIYSIFR